MQEVGWKKHGIPWRLDLESCGVILCSHQVQHAWGDRTNHAGGFATEVLLQSTTVDADLASTSAQEYPCGGVFAATSSVVLSN